MVKYGINLNINNLDLDLMDKKIISTHLWDNC